MLEWKFVIVLVVIMTLGSALICDDDECVGRNCSDPKELALEHQPPCKENQRYNSYGTYCGCCPACVDILDEGSPCSPPEDFDFDAPPDLWECKKGLECNGRHCVGPKSTTMDYDVD